MSFRTFRPSLQRIGRPRWQSIAHGRRQYALHTTQLSHLHHEQVAHWPHRSPRAFGGLERRHYSSSPSWVGTSGQSDGHRYLVDHFSLINPTVQKQIQAAFPHFKEPTLAQALLWQTMREQSDVLFRAHTGSGKSLGLLIALLDRIPNLYESLRSDTAPHKTTSIIVVPTRPLAQQYAYWAEQLLPPDLRTNVDSVLQVTHEKGINADTFISSIEGKPTPHIRIFTVSALKALLTDLSVSRPHSAAQDEEAKEARHAAQKARRLLNIRDLETLILDEPDAMLNLPGRFEYQEMAWKRKLLWTGKGSHIPPLIDVMNIIMSKRRSFSAGPVIDEPVDFDRSVMGPTRAAREKDMRRLRKQFNKEVIAVQSENRIYLNQATTSPNRTATPLQLVIVGASVNSVIRKFLSHRSGWLITRASDEHEAGKWIDLTGMTSVDKCARELRDLPKELLPLAMTDSQASEQIPRSIRHCCVVVDEPSMRSKPPLAPENEGDHAAQPESKERSDRSSTDSSEPPSTEKAISDPQLADSYTHQLRNLDMRLSSSSYRLEAEEEQVQGELLNVRLVAARPMQKTDPRFDFAASADFALLSGLAYIWTTMGVRRGLAILPDGWSLDDAKRALCLLGVPAVNTDEAIQTSKYHVARSQSQGESEQCEQGVLHLVKRSNIRGIDIVGGVSHAFILGFESVQDSAGYVHLAGRVSRMNSSQLPADPGEQPTPAGEIHRPPGTVVTLLQGVDDRMRRTNIKYIRSKSYDDQEYEETAEERRARVDRDMQSEEAMQLDHSEKQKYIRIMKQLMLDRPKRISSPDEVRMAGLYKALKVTLDRVEPLPLASDTETGALRRLRERAGVDETSKRAQPFVPIPVAPALKLRKTLRRRRKAEIKKNPSPTTAFRSARVKLDTLSDLLLEQRNEVLKRENDQEPWVAHKQAHRRS